MPESGAPHLARAFDDPAPASPSISPFHPNLDYCPISVILFMLCSYIDCPMPKSSSSAGNHSTQARKAPPRSARSRAIRERLSPDCIARMRDLVEGSCRSYKRIGEELGIATATVSRYAAEGGWQRPPGAPLPARIGEQRERVTQKLWALTERHAEALEAQPLELAQRSLQPLARLTRTLGEMDKHIRPPLAAPDGAPKPRRTLNELRDELVAHLERINREEGYGWDVREWWFKDGGGI
jgi:hypothetical protein